MKLRFAGDFCGENKIWYNYVYYGESKHLRIIRMKIHSEFWKI